MSADHEAWLRDDKGFRAELSAGYVYQHYVAQQLREHGLDAKVPPLRIRPSVEKRDEFSDRGDLQVGSHSLEVKSRTIAFQKPQDIAAMGFKSLRFYGKYAYDHLKIKPLAIVVISQSTRAMLVVAARSYRDWTPEYVHDKRRGYSQYMYGIPLDKLRSFADLVTYLKENP